MDPDPSPLAPIFSNLSREIRRPLDALQAGLAGLLDDPDGPVSDADRSHALTLLGLCEDLRQITIDTLGGGPTPGPIAD